MVLISVTGHMVIAGTFNYFCALPLQLFICPSAKLSWSSFYTLCDDPKPSFLKGLGYL